MRADQLDEYLKIKEMADSVERNLLTAKTKTLIMGNIKIT